MNRVEDAPTGSAHLLQSVEIGLKSAADWIKLDRRTGRPYGMDLVTVMIIGRQDRPVFLTHDFAHQVEDSISRREESRLYRSIQWKRKRSRGGGFEYGGGREPRPC